MTHFLPLALILAACTGFAADSPFACDRSALTPEARKHHFDELMPAMRKLVKSVKELPDGYAFELPADNAAIQLAAEFSSNERLCCPFFEFDLHVGDNSAPMVLRITGPEGVKQFIKAELSGMVG